MFPQRMRPRRTSSGGEAGRTANVAALCAIVATPNAGTRIATRHVDPTPPATFALNSAKASTGLLCGRGARACKGCSNRKQADDHQITHALALLLTATLFGQCHPVKGDSSRWGKLARAGLYPPTACHVLAHRSQRRPAALSRASVSVSQTDSSFLS